MAEKLTRQEMGDYFDLRARFLEYLNKATEMYLGGTGSATYIIPSDGCLYVGFNVAGTGLELVIPINDMLDTCGDSQLLCDLIHKVDTEHYGGSLLAHGLRRKQTDLKSKLADLDDSIVNCKLSARAGDATENLRGYEATRLATLTALVDVTDQLKKVCNGR